jgi:hypothetical protein
MTIYIVVSAHLRSIAAPPLAGQVAELQTTYLAHLASRLSAAHTSRYVLIKYLR